MDNYKNKTNLIKEKFSSVAQIQSNSQQESQYSSSLRELRKCDLFDLGVMLLLAATGGMELMPEEYL